jgi:alpha-L-arabinofuranosidase
MRILWLGVLIALAALAAQAAAPAPDSSIRVDAGRVISWMYGSCIEDVNHEIYGGLYAQMLFGESFEEPPAPAPISGWAQYGGDWRVRDGAATVSPNSGAKLVRASPEITDASVACEVRFDAPGGDNAGLILRVQNPRTGADTWSGYEISLSPLHQTVLLGRHREDWHFLRDAPLPVSVGQWHRLRVELAGPRLRVFVDGSPTPQIDYTDTEAPILNGRVGLRTWNSAASFRHLTVDTAAGHVEEAFPAPREERGDTVSGMWEPIRTSAATGRFTWDADRPFNTSHSQRIEQRGAGVCGVANRGLNRWGIAVRQGRRYDGRLYLRQRGYAGKVTVAIQSADGSRTYATRRIGGLGADWKRCAFSLRASATDSNARFAVWIDRPGTVWVDQAVLTPTGSDLFHGLPFRADIGNALVREGLTFLRYGGTMVNAPEYRWKRMIGDPDRRPQYRGHWCPYSTNGFGIEEFVRFCEAARFEPVFAINIEERPQDAADLVEYLNGPSTSPWGRRRAENGHPQPYRVRYVEIGNEEALDGSRAEYAHYLERFERLYAAMHPVDPDLQLVIAAWWRPEEPLVKQTVQRLNGKAALWDVHVGGDGLGDGRDADRIFTQMQRLFQEWAPGTRMRAAVFEENGNRHDLQRALGHASILNATQRHGDFVRMDCPANCLQPWRQNDNGWDQGQVFFTSSQVWGMPPYYAQQMAAANHQPEVVASTASSPDDALDALALRSEDGNELVVRVVNLSDRPHATRLSLNGFQPSRSTAEVVELRGRPEDVNPPEEPTRIVPTRRIWQYGLQSGTPIYSFPPYSFTILQFQ